MVRGKLKHSGFTAIELTVVVAIILLITAIGLPHLLGAKKKAVAASVVASIKAVQTAESMYQTAYPAKGYSPSLLNLGSNGSTCETTSPTNACILDPVLASGFKDGYAFNLLGDGNTPDLSYTLTATPESSSAGDCMFSSDQSGNIQSSSGSTAQGRSGGITGSGASGPC